MEPQEPKLEIPLPSPDVQKIGEHLDKQAIDGKAISHTQETIRQSIQEVSNAPVAPKQQNSDTLDVLPEYTKNYSAEDKQKIEDLLQVAADKGLDAANSMAESEQPYILDAFHDALAEKLLPYLKQKGIIK